MDIPAESLAVRRASFLSASADDYDRHRPDYPVEAIRWAVGDRPRRILDVGCGPGNLTKQLTALGTLAVGVDPSITMLRGMRSIGLPVVCGAAEALPFRTSCADQVTAATAFHWFDASRAVPEFWRVLRPGGRVAILTNFRDETVDWVRELSGIIGSEAAMSATLGGEEGLETEFGTRLTHGGFFDSVEHKVFTHEQELDEEGLVGLVRSRSYIAILPEEHRNELLTAVRTLCHDHPHLKGKERFVLHYKTHTFRCRAKK